MRKITAALLATTLFVSNVAVAAENSAPLPSGKPAGSQQAALLGPNVFLVLLGVGVVIGGIALAVSNNSKNGVTTPSTTGTP